MDFVKVFKNNRHTIMVWLLVLIMITFVGGSILQQVLSRRGPSKQVVATLSDGTKIRGDDRVVAANELDVLRSLNAPQLLAYTGLNGFIISNLIFPDSSSSSTLEAQLKYACMQGQLVIEESVIDSYFKAKAMDPITAWIVLNQQAFKYGANVSTEKAQELLTAMNQEAAKLVQSVSMKHHVPQENVVEIFAKVLSIANYVDMACKNANVTMKDVELSAGISNEKFTAEVATLNADSFMAEVTEPTEAQLSEQFAKYKSLKAGDITESNPYGFGYMLDNMVQLEYLIVNYDDVEAIVEAPTEETKEEYYALHKSKYSEKVLSNPDDKQSDMVEKIKPYSKVIRQVENDITADKTNVLMQEIIRELKKRINAGLMDKNIESLTAEQMKEYAGDYKTAAQEVGQKYGITIYTGTTGYLTKEALMQDRNLGRLAISRQGRLPVDLVKMAFAVEGLDIEKISQFDGKAPKVFQNIGPMENMWPKNSTFVRVVAYRLAGVAQSFDEEIDTTGSNETVAEPTKNTYAVKDDVAQDCKLLAAMEIAKAKAQDFITKAGVEDWAEFAKKYNTENKTRVYVSKLEDKTRTSDFQMLEEKIKSSYSTNGEQMYNYALSNKMLNDKLYAMKDATPGVVGLPATKTVYAVKSLEITAPTEAELEEAIQNAEELNAKYSSEAVLVFLNPDNITARSGLVFKESKDEKPEEVE